MPFLNMPIQVISCCNMDGTFTPLRFRYRDQEEALISVEICEVLSSKLTTYGRSDNFVYTCRAIVGDRKVLFTIKYVIKDHKWELQEIKG